MTSSSWLSFSPRDTVFIRDGRSFDAASDATAHTVWPGPTTVAGAVGAAYGTNPEEVRGPVLARRVGGAWEPYFPVPADLVCTTDATPYAFRMVLTLAGGPTDLDSGEAGPADDGGQRRWLMPPLEAEPARPADGWIPGRVLVGYLAGDWPGSGGIELDDLELVRQPLLPERRVGLARDAGHRARTGFFYQSTHLRPDGDWAFLAECAFKPGWKHQAGSTVSFGGRGRLADVATAMAQWPEAPGGSVKNRVLVYLATPALWRDGWRIPVPDGARLVAAATGEPEPAATITPGEGWARTRMLRWAVPAGSVYLLEFDDAEVGAEWARKVHGTALERDVHDIAGERNKTDLLRTAGFGVVLTGSVDVTELLLYLYAESPVHTGAADSVDVLDLPVQREAATGYPVIWGQSLKGALRQAARDAGWEPGMITSVFGSEVAEAAAGGSTSPGGLAVGDAQLVAMPVPALRRTFAWVTSEIALGRLARKYRALGLEVPGVPEVRTGEGVAATVAWTDAPSEVLGPCVLPLGSAANDRLARWAARLAEDALGEGAGFGPFTAKLGRDLIMAGSDVMPVLLRECTEQSVRVQLATESKTVENGPFYSEYLPAETILASALTLRRGADDAAARAALGSLLDGKLLQVGGDETLGKGLVWGRLIGLPS